MPVQGALFPEIEITDHQDRDIQHHFVEAIPTKQLVKFAIYISPRVEKDGFDVEQKENDSDQIPLYRERFSRVAGGLHAALVGLLFGAIRASPADQYRQGTDQPRQDGGDQKVKDQRSVGLQA